MTSLFSRRPLPMPAMPAPGDGGSLTVRLLLALLLGLVGGYLANEVHRTGQLAALVPSLRARMSLSDDWLSYDGGDGAGDGGSDDEADGGEDEGDGDGAGASSGGDEEEDPAASRDRQVLARLRGMLDDFSAKKLSAQELAEVLLLGHHEQAEEDAARNESLAAGLPHWEPLDVRRAFLVDGVDPQILRDLGPWATGGFTYGELMATKGDRLPGGATLAPTPPGFENRTRPLFNMWVLGGQPYFSRWEVRTMLLSYYYPTLQKIFDFHDALKGVAGRLQLHGAPPLPDALFVFHVDPYPLLTDKPPPGALRAADSLAAVAKAAAAREAAERAALAPAPAVAAGANASAATAAPLPAGPVLRNVDSGDALDLGAIPAAPPAGSAPLFTLCKTDAHWDVLYPNMYFGPPRRWADVTGALRREADRWPYSKRRRSVWWRGSMGDTWPGAAPRARAVGMYHSAKWADFGFTDRAERWEAVIGVWKTKPWWPTLPPGLADAPHGSDLSMDMAAVAQYKLALHLPGFFQATYSRTLQFLLWTGAAVLMHESPYYEFYYHRLRPGKHYILVNLTTLPDAVRTAQANVAATHKVAWAASRVARRWLTGDAVGNYWASLLTTYARLQRFNPRAIARPDSLCTCWGGAAALAVRAPPEWLLPGATHCGLFCERSKIANDPAYQKPWTGFPLPGTAGGPPNPAAVAAAAAAAAAARARKPSEARPGGGGGGGSGGGGGGGGGGKGSGSSRERRRRWRRQRDRERASGGGRKLLTLDGADLRTQDDAGAPPAPAAGARLPRRLADGVAAAVQSVVDAVWGPPAAAPAARGDADGWAPPVADDGYADDGGGADAAVDSVGADDTTQAAWGRDDVYDDAGGGGGGGAAKPAPR